MRFRPCAFWFAILVCAWGVAPARAQADKVSVDTTPGYARLLFSFQKPTAVSASVADGVLTIRLAQSLPTSAEALAGQLGTYVSSARRDADGLTYRFALRKPVALHSSTQLNQTAVDLVPDSFAGVPPDLPPPPPPPAKALLDVTKLPVIKVRVAQFANYTRLVFDWPRQVPYTVYPGHGRVSVRFETLAKPDFSMLESQTPPWVKSAGWHVDEKTLVVEFETDSDAGFRYSRDGNKILVDVLAPKTDASVLKMAGDAGRANPSNGKPVPPNTDAAAINPSSVAARATAAGGSALMAGAAVSLPPAAELTRGGAVLHFPAARGHAVAAFTRGNTIWIVLDNHPALDPVTLLSGISSLIEKADASQFDGAALLRLTLKSSLVPVVSESDVALDIALASENATPPMAIALTREGANGRAALSAALPGAVRVLSLTDDKAGDNILVIPAHPGRAVLTPKRFVELDALPTAAGLAVLAHSDTLETRVHDETVTFSDPNGLVLSEAISVNPAPIVEPQKSTEGPAFVDFTHWSQAEPGDVYSAIHKLRAATSKLPESSANKGRLRLAQYLLAEHLAPEALGEIQMMQSSDPHLENDPALLAMTGAAQYMMARYGDSQRTLSAPSFDGNPHIALWRGLSAARLNDWANARRNLRMAQRVLRLYPQEWRTQAQLARAETGLAMSDLAVTNDALDQLPRDLPPKEAREARFFKARLLAAQGHVNEAIAQLRVLEQSTDIRMASRALYARVDLQLATGKIKHAQAAEALENLHYRWRGDDLELNTLRKLGALYFSDKNWRAGLESLRSASLNFPTSELARQAQDDMRATFVSLFLDGKADAMKPVDALSLFYDFIELTPIGRDGDEMIRKLSDRLVTVDLLGPAEELLQHQVSERLDGVARAAVATKLALIYLLDHKPKEALQAINDTRQTGLPDDLNAQRRMLEARALTGLKQFDAAADLIADDEAVEAKDLRADIYWQAGNWPVAGAKNEERLGERWQSTAPLSEGERAQVLRAAVAYSLAGDETSVARLREHFAAGMQSSPNAKAFAVVTDPVQKNGLAIRDLARSIASVNTLQAYLDDLRQKKKTAVTN